MQIHKKYFFCFLLYLNVLDAFSKQSKIDSLIGSLKNAKYDTSRIRLRNEIGEESMLLRIGYWDSLRNDAEKYDMKKYEANALNNIGYIYQLQGQIDKTLEFLHKSLAIREKINDKQGISNSLNNIAFIYQNHGQIEKALEYYHKSLAINEEINDKGALAYSLNNIAFLSQQKGEIDKALEYYDKSLSIRKEIKDKRGIAESLHNIASIYQDKKEIDKALEYFNESLSIYEEINDKQGTAITLNSIGKIEFDQGKYKEAEARSSRSLEIGKELGYPEIISSASKMLSDIYAKTDRYKNAYENYVLFKKMADSVFNRETQKSVVEKQMQYEFEKKETVLKADQEKKNIAYEAENKRSRLILIFVAACLAGVVIVSIIIYRSLKITRTQNKIIENQKQAVEKAKRIIEEKNKDITDSINYAQRIQKALLASDELLAKNLSEYFILFKPKDIVSGDFYWAAEKNGKFYFAVCDSTGHGVPGAFMSLLNISFLNEAIAEKGIEKPNEIFNHVRKRLIENISLEGAQDGMDAILLSIDLKNKKTIEYAAANNTALLANNSIKELDSDDLPVGLSVRKDSFNLRTFNAAEGTLYLYTDGFADQFGGPKGKKFMYKQLNEKLLSISNHPLAEQKRLLENAFDEWKGNLDQVDDVLVIGVRI